MMLLLLVVIVTQVTSELIHVVTPENEHAGVVEEVSTDANATLDENDTYLKAYRDLHNVAERRNPLGSYADNHNYNTLAHSSYVDEDVYPEFSYKTHPHKYHRYHPVPSVVYGPPSPVSYYHHHHHHQEEIPTHHTVIGFPVVSPFHHLSSFLAKVGLQKIFKLMAKIAVLKIILKFVAIVALFFVFPALLPREKDKGETEDDRLLDNLNEVTDWVWNGITEREKMDGDDEEEEEDDDEEEEEQQHDEEENNHHHSDKDKDKDKHKDKDKDEEELDGTDLKLLNKIIKEWKEENFGGPDKGSAVSFLVRFVNVVNSVLGFLLGYIKMKYKNMDVLDAMVLDRVSFYMKDVMKMWPKIKSVLTG